MVKQYKPYEVYLVAYKNCLISYKAGDLGVADCHSFGAMRNKPEFLTKEFCDQHKRRLYTKDNNFYKRFREYGESQENWYYVDGKLLKYINGKIVNK